jgi:hypothetical protein
MDDHSSDCTGPRSSQYDFEQLSRSVLFQEAKNNTKPIKTRDLRVTRKAPIVRLVRPFQEFAATETSGAGWLGGIGFTMSLFVAGLAFTDDALLTIAKLSIPTASAVALVGFSSLAESARQPERGRLRCTSTAYTAFWPMTDAH